MNRKQLDRLSPLHLIGGTIFFSLVFSAAVYLTNRALRGGDPSGTEDGESGGTGVGTSSVPVIPTVDPGTPDPEPAHFTEAAMVPGFTETGAQIEHDDDVEGRSPGGV